MKKQVLFSVISILILLGFTIEVGIIVQKNRSQKADYYASLRVTLPILLDESSTTKKKDDDTFIVAPAKVDLDNMTTTTVTKRITTTTTTTITTTKKKTTTTTKGTTATKLTATTKLTTGPNKTIPVHTEAIPAVTTTHKPDPVVTNITYSEENETYYKYGTKITTTSTYMVVVYDNGETVKTLVGSRSQYDKSGFNGTALEMKNEAKQSVKTNKNIINSVVDMTNYYRTMVGVNEVKYNEELSIAATVRAMEMAYSGGIYNISHTRPNKQEWYTVITDLNYHFGKYLAENIAAGYVSGDDVTLGWYRSESHRKNMLNTRYTKIGVGYYELDGDKFWVQLYSN